MKCSKCKRELSEEVAFCSKCGTSVEATKKKYADRKRLLTALIAAVAVLALVAVVVLSIVNANEKNRLSRSISAANVAAGGEVATCGKRVR